MAQTIDKIVKSKYPPKDKNVMWVDTNSNPPVQKIWDGTWKPMEVNENVDYENNSNLIQNNEERLRDSYKINVSIHDNSLRNDAFLSIPRNDEPFPDMDELSTESPLLRRSSLISD